MIDDKESYLYNEETANVAISAQWLISFQIVMGLVPVKLYLLNHYMFFHLFVLTEVHVYPTIDKCILICPITSLPV